MATLRTIHKTLVARFTKKMTRRALVNRRLIGSVQANWTLEGVHELVDVGLGLKMF